MKQTAQGLAALGRGPDTELVHMAPSEVAGLQSLAQQHGGSLTINPETGLPEAGFLSSILPMVLGAGAMMIPGMQGIGAGWIGAGIGGLTTLATGSLSKGLMAGLGAYGGAGLAEGLAGASAATTVPEVAAATSTPAAAAVPQAVLPTATATAAPVVGAAPTAVPAGYGGFAPTETAYGAFGEAPINAASQVATTTAPTAVAAPLEARSALDAGMGQYYPEAPVSAASNPLDARLAGGQAVTPMSQTTGQFLTANMKPIGAMGLSALMGMEPDKLNAPAADKGMIRPFTYSREKIPSAFQDVAGAPMSSRERRYFTDAYTAGTPYKAPGPEYLAANGGIVNFAAGGPVEEMSNANAIGANTGYPMSGIHTGAYATPYQQPMSENVVQGAQDAAVDPYTGQAQFAMGGGVSDLGGYSDGGRLLRGPGDGVSDDIPAMIGQKQQARLADGEFVVPARIVSELGNGSTEAGARQLYAMMDRVQKARSKSIGKNKVATDSKAHKLMPA
jgi:hypothetical protein